MNWSRRFRPVLGVLPEGLRARLPASWREDEEEQRVHSLWRNRAELKKAYSNALDEVQRLKDRVKQQEGATARVQEQFDELEARLAQPDTAWPAVAFYHLRELWSLARLLVQQFITDLESQQADRERRAALAEFNRKQFARRQAVEGECLEATSALAQAIGHLQSLEQRLAQQQRIWHYFARRRTRQALQEAGTRRLLAEQVVAEAQARRDAVEAEQVEYQGLSLDARRAINLAALGYGVLLRERLEANGLFEAVRRAADRREPPEGEYGDRRSCEQLIASIAVARTALQAREGVLAEIRRRADAMRATARYRASSDALPTADSLGGTAKPGGRLLLEDSWEIHRVLLS